MEKIQESKKTDAVSFSTKFTSPLLFKSNLTVKFLTPKLEASKSHSTKLQSGMQNLEQ